jgi:hypothetical protein
LLPSHPAAEPLVAESAARAWTLDTATTVNPSLLLRILYALCLAGATIVHLIFHFQHGVLLGALEGYGYPLSTRIFWSSLTLLDPLAAALLLVRPRVGLVLAASIIVADVVHNTWILQHLGNAPDAAYWAQIAFLAFLAATMHIAWRRASSRESVAQARY